MIPSAWEDSIAHKAWPQAISPSSKGKSGGLETV